MAAEPAYWAVIPAAGAGARFGADIPKQYLMLRGRCVIEHTLGRFLNHPRISGVMVALAPDDVHWQGLALAGHPALFTCSGGSQRCHSVLNAVRALHGHAAPQDWVLVHDAARPCVSTSDIERLIGAASAHPVGGILAAPVRDTMKRADEDGAIARTERREGLWHAMTPQMFRLAELRDALEQAESGGHIVTDEAQAVELQGRRPLLVPGESRNIKITLPEDLVIADLLLSIQEKETCE
jgi:2-C-methyl-D-erythritol 4-phosphate cytidylyltransferase